MRRIVVFLLLMAALAPSRTLAGPDNADIRGRVIDGHTGAPRPGVPVVLVAGASRDVLRSRTDERGRFEFRDLDSDEDARYVVAARYGDGLFANGPLTVSSPRRRLDVRVWDTSTDPTAISVERNVIFVAPSEGEVAILESITVSNRNDRAYIGRTRRHPRGPWTSPALGLPLPARVNGSGVQIVESSTPILNLVPTDFGVGVTSAIPPGETRITFAYRLRGLIGSYDLSRTAMYQTRDVSVFAVDPFTVSSDRLEPSGTQQIGDERYRVWSSTKPIEAGDPLQIMATAQAGAGPAVIGGLVAAALVGMLGLVALGRSLVKRARSRESKSRPCGGDDPSKTRREIVAAIAELDLSYRSGEITEADWRERRAALKSELLAT